MKVPPVALVLLAALAVVSFPPPAQAQSPRGTEAWFTFSHVGGQHAGLLHAVRPSEVELSLGGVILRRPLSSVLRIESPQGNWVYDAQFREMKFFPSPTIDLSGLGYRNQPRSRFDVPPPRAFSGRSAVAVWTLNPAR